MPRIVFADARASYYINERDSTTGTSTRRGWSYIVNEIRDLTRHAFLHLQAAGIHIHDAGISKGRSLFHLGDRRHERVR